MSLKDELRAAYKSSTYETIEYQAEFDKLKQSLLKEASNGKTECWIYKDDFPLIKNDVLATTMWLEENELQYNAHVQGNKFGHLVIKWD